MRRIDMRKVLYTTLVIALLCSCGKNNEPEPVPPTPPAAELPEPPSEMNANNAFCVDYFTDLKDENSYFVRRDIGIAKNHILGEEGKKAVMFFFLVAIIGIFQMKMTHDKEVQQ